MTDKMPDQSAVSEADQLTYLAMKRPQMPELETCRCDAAPYLHLTAIVPGTADQPDTTPVRACLVAQEAAETITILRITGGSRVE